MVRDGMSVRDKQTDRQADIGLGQGLKEEYWVTSRCVCFFFFCFFDRSYLVLILILILHVTHGIGMKTWGLMSFSAMGCHMEEVDGDVIRHGRSQGQTHVDRCEPVQADRTRSEGRGGSNYLKQTCLFSILNRYCCCCCCYSISISDIRQQAPDQRSIT